MTRPIIYEGIFKDMRDLNRTLPSPKMRDIGIGRAYWGPKKLTKGFGVHAYGIHMKCCGENGHLERIDDIWRTSSDYEGTLYIGAGGLINLAYVAAAQPGGAMFIDINPVQTLFWEKSFDMAAACPDVEDFLRYIRQARQHLALYLSPVFENYDFNDRRRAQPREEQSPEEIAKKAWHFQTGIESRIEMNNEDGWWIRRNYRYIHEMAKAKALGALTIDITDEAAWIQLEAYLSGKVKKDVDIAYLSNIFWFMTSYDRGVHFHDFCGRMTDAKIMEGAINNIGRILTKARSPFIIDHTFQGTAAGYFPGAQHYPQMVAA